MTRLYHRETISTLGPIAIFLLIMLKICVFFAAKSLETRENDEKQENM